MRGDKYLSKISIVDGNRSDRFAREAVRIIDDLFLLGFNQQDIINIHLISRLMLEHIIKRKIDGEIVGIEGLMERVGLRLLWDVDKK
jgi:hypothetical protein